MKKLFTSFFTLSVVLLLCNLAAFGQGRGQSRGPAVGAGAGPQVNQQRKEDRTADKQVGKGEDRREATFDDRIERNPNLKSKVESMLPAGMDLKTASAGFKNEGQFIAALHVSKNLNIPFADLKAKMTGSNPVSLGSAIHALKPNMSEKDAKSEAEKAEKMAKETEKTKVTT